MDMMFSLDTSGKKHLYVQIYEYIKSEIREGRLLQGEKLPSTRILANNLQVSRATIDLAYEQLVSEGYLEARAGSGYYVCQVEELYGFSEKLGAAMPFSIQDTEALLDFSTSAIDMTAFPFGVWRKLNKTVLSEDNGMLFTLGDPQGDLELRQTVSRIDQNILRQFMEEGHFERHLNRMRKTYRLKHDEMLRLLKPFFKKFIVKGENAGTYLTLTSKEGKTEAELIALAKEVGVKVYGISQNVSWEGEEYHTVLLGFGALTLEQIKEGLSLLSKVYL